MSEQKIKVIPRDNIPPTHPLYPAFSNAKSVAVELARIIAKESGNNTKADVRKFLDEFERKTA